MISVRTLFLEFTETEFFMCNPFSFLRRTKATLGVRVHVEIGGITIADDFRTDSSMGEGDTSAVTDDCSVIEGALREQFGVLVMLGECIATEGAFGEDR